MMQQLLFVVCLLFHGISSFKPPTPVSAASTKLRSLGPSLRRNSDIAYPTAATTCHLAKCKSSLATLPTTNIFSPSNVDRVSSSYSNVHAYGGTTALLAKKFATTDVLNTLSSQFSGRPSNRRAKMGPPKRKQQHYRSQEERDDPVNELGLHNRNQFSRAGRVSVYCVGSSIDISALRAHVFRRGFGNNSQQEQQLRSAHASSTSSRNISALPTMETLPSANTLRLTRRAEDPILDDEVLHVSNAPMFIAANNRLASWDDGDQLEEIIDEMDKNSETNGRLHPSLEPITTSPKTREALFMATQDIFYFEYGCVVFWGLTSHEEQAALEELAPFITEPVTPMELENSFDTMEYIFDQHGSSSNSHNNPNHRPIKFDRMKLRSLGLEEKLAYSYAMAQSSKLFVFESKVLQSVERTRYLPKELATRGKITCSKRELNSLIGQLFVEQTEVNLFSSILDTPDFLWDDDEYLPTYQFARSYLEVDHRVSLLNSRLSVIRELLDVLTAQVADNNSTRLEWIVIWLIVIEIALGIATSPLFAVGNRALASLALPVAIFLYKQMTTSEK